MTNAVRSIQTLRLMTIGALGLMALMISEPSFAGTPVVMLSLMCGIP